MASFSSWNGRKMTGKGSLLIVEASVEGGPSAPVTLGGRDVTAQLRALGRDWGEIAVPLRCLANVDLAKVTQPFAMSTAGALDLTISGIRLGSPGEGVVDCR